MLRLVIVASHPIQYHAPLFKEVAKLCNIECVVLYCDDIGVEPIYVDEFKTTIKWDIPLLDGYKYKFLKNYSGKVVNGFFSRVNPTLFSDIIKNKYDVILINGYDNLSCWFSFFSAKLVGVKVIWRGESTLRGVENNSTLKQIVKKIVLKLFFRSCDAVMYSCSGNQKYLKFYGVDEHKNFPIPCAVNNDYFQRERKKYINNIKQIRIELGVHENEMVILFSARFTARKRPLDLLKALTKIDNSNITVLFVGDGTERLNIERYAKKNSIKSIFAGFKNQSEISKYYSVADLSIVISGYDPSPKAMNEAMNFELPIIVTDVVGTAYDLVKDGENGFIVNVGDINALSERIDYLNRNRGIIKTMGKKSLLIVQKSNFEEDARGIMKALNYVMSDKN